MPSGGEIGEGDVTPAENQRKPSRRSKPIRFIPVALSQVHSGLPARSFCFVELEVKDGPRLSKTGLTVPKDQLNVNAPTYWRV